MNNARNATVKSTINVNQAYMDELKRLVSMQVIESLTDGINQGIELLIKEKRKKLYADELAQAAKDSDFIKRTLDVQKEFDNLESGAPGEG